MPACIAVGFLFVRLHFLSWVCILAPWYILPTIHYHFFNPESYPMNSTYRTHIRLFALFILSSLTFLSGCSDDPTGPEDSTVTRPGIGSTFTLAGYYTDDAGNVVESSRDTTVSTLTQIHPTLKGQSNVYEFDGKFGTTFLSYADNGDLYLLFQVSLSGGGKDSVWLRLPVSSGDEVTQELSRDQQAMGPAILLSTMTYTAKRTGTQTVAIGSKSFSTQRIDATITIESEYIINGVSEQNLQIYNNISVDFAPELGYLNRQETVITNDANSSVGPGVHTALIDYTLK